MDRPIPLPPAIVSGISPATLALLRNFPDDARDAYLRFAEHRLPADADIVVTEVVLRHRPESSRHITGPLPDTAGLIADLGFDSIAITEMVFFLEDLFHVRITNEEILSVSTVGDLRGFVRRKLAAPLT